MAATVAVVVLIALVGAHGVFWLHCRRVSDRTRMRGATYPFIPIILGALLPFDPDPVISSPACTPNPMVIATKRATSLKPIIFAAAADPLGTGLVASLARPGGNVTGLSIQHTDLASKHLELLREMVPGFDRLAIMVNVENPASMLEMRQVDAAARPLNLEVVAFGIRQSDEIGPALKDMKENADDALYVCIDTLLFSNRTRSHGASSDDF
jgi:ABC-type uncharacterized transport system substrate-binding protein